MAQKLDFQYFWLIIHIKLRSFNVKGLLEQSQVS